MTDFDFERDVEFYELALNAASQAQDYEQVLALYASAPASFLADDSLDHQERCLNAFNSLLLTVPEDDLDGNYKMSEEARRVYKTIAHVIESHPDGLFAVKAGEALFSYLHQKAETEITAERGHLDNIKMRDRLLRNYIGILSPTICTLPNDFFDNDFAIPAFGLIAAGKTKDLRLCLAMTEEALRLSQEKESIENKDGEGWKAVRSLIQFAYHNGEPLSALKMMQKVVDYRLLNPERLHQLLGDVVLMAKTSEGKSAPYDPTKLIEQGYGLRAADGLQTTYLRACPTKLIEQRQALKTAEILEGLFNQLAAEMNEGLLQSFTSAIVDVYVAAGRTEPEAAAKGLATFSERYLVKENKGIAERALLYIGFSSVAREEGVGTKIVQSVYASTRDPKVKQMAVRGFRKFDLLRRPRSPSA